MNRNFSPNPYGNPYAANGGGDLFRPPFSGGGPPLNNSPFQSPPFCRQFMPRVASQQRSVPFFSSRTPEGSHFFRSPPVSSEYGQVTGFNGQSPGSLMPGSGYRSPRCTSPATSPFNGNGSFGPDHRGLGQGGPHFSHGRGKSPRYANNSRQSWSGTPCSEPGRGYKRSNPGFAGTNSVNSNIQRYYSPKMLTDPWAGLSPVSVSKVTRHSSTH
jgi:hypothetical protein